MTTCGDGVPSAVDSIQAVSSGNAAPTATVDPQSSIGATLSSTVPTNNDVSFRNEILPNAVTHNKSDLSSDGQRIRNAMIESLDWKQGVDEKEKYGYSVVPFVQLLKDKAEDSNHSPTPWLSVYEDSVDSSKVKTNERIAVDANLYVACRALVEGLPTPTHKGCVAGVESSFKYCRKWLRIMKVKVLENIIGIDNSSIDNPNDTKLSLLRSIINSLKSIRHSDGDSEPESVLPVYTLMLDREHHGAWLLDCVSGGTRSSNVSYLLLVLRMLFVGLHPGKMHHRAIDLLSEAFGLQDQNHLQASVILAIDELLSKRTAACPTTRECRSSVSSAFVPPVYAFSNEAAVDRFENPVTWITNHRFGRNEIRAVMDGYADESEWSNSLSHHLTIEEKKGKAACKIAHTLKDTSNNNISDAADILATVIDWDSDLSRLALERSRSFSLRKNASNTTKTSAILEDKAVVRALVRDFTDVRITQEELRK